MASFASRSDDRPSPDKRLRACWWEPCPWRSPHMRREGVAGGRPRARVRRIGFAPPRSGTQRTVDPRSLPVSQVPGRGVRDRR